MKMNKIVKKIMQLEPVVAQYQDSEFKRKTSQFRKEIASGKSKSELLPETFAVVREAVKRVTGKRLYNVQLLGGIAICQGKIAELKAGEGKTLTASLPAYFYALEQKGVHIVTTNDYLAKRDFEQLREVFEFLGVSVGLIYPKMDLAERKEAYQKDITYGTNTEFGFDYIRDNLVHNPKHIVQRKLNCAIVDEADSILIDEAQTPMIISKKRVLQSPEPYKKADSFVKGLHGISVIKENRKDKKQQEEIEAYDYVVDETYKLAELTNQGIHKAEKEYRLNNYYDIQNLAIINDIKQALIANAILKKDIDYIVEKEKIEIINKMTGRIEYGKRFVNGLAEAVEAKESLRIDEGQDTLGSILTGAYFSMYPSLAGMTGTAQSAKDEFAEIYGLEVITIPTNKPIKRVDRKERIFINKQAKYEEILEEVKQSYENKQPVLIGTSSVEESEKVSNLLTLERLPHAILNAKHHKEEADIVKQAGDIARITVATNMAGRGTNIVLGGEEGKGRKEVLNVGGLKVIGTEKQISKRVEEQLRGRSGRQGDIGESMIFCSLEDDMIKMHLKPKRITRYDRKKELFNISVKTEIKQIQSHVEKTTKSYRKRILNYDRVVRKK